MNFIQTPIATLYFESSNPLKIIMKKEFLNYTFDNIKWTNLIHFKKFSSLYDWDKMYVKNTDNGLFLYIHLDDPAYGEPCFKIYTKL